MVFGFFFHFVVCDFIRMRGYVKRGGVSSRIEYGRLENDVYDEVYSLDKEGVALHDNDVQHIAMVKAQEKGVDNFKVR